MRKLVAGVLGLTMALSVAGIAFAVANNNALNQTGTAIAPSGAGCTDLPEGVTVGAGESAWHFIWNGGDGSATAWGHFAFSDGVQELESSAQGSVQAWWIVTDSSVTLDGSQTWTDGVGGQFTLSSSCTAGGPTPTPTLPPTNTIDQNPTQPAGTSLTLLFGLILATAAGLVAYAMRPRRSMR